MFVFFGDICELFIYRVFCFFCFVWGIFFGLIVVNMYKFVFFEFEFNLFGNIYVGFYGYVFMLEKRLKLNWKEYFFLKKFFIYKIFRYCKIFLYL